MVTLYLPCGSKDEATKIGEALLEAQLVACVRQIPVQSAYWWKSKVEHDDEILLMLESLEEKFDAINAKVSELHSDEAYALTMTKVAKTTPSIERWLNEVLQ